MSESRDQLPDVVVSTTSVESASVDLLFIPVFGRADDLADVRGLDAAVAGEWGRLRESGEFTERLYDVSVAPVRGAGWQAARVGFVAAGPQEELDAERMRRIAAACSHLACRRGGGRVGVLLRSALRSPEGVRAVADGLTAAEFEAGTYKREAHPRAPVTHVTLVAPAGEADELDRAASRGVAAGRAANTVRALVNEPANVLTPPELVRRVLTMAGEAGVSTEVLEEDALRDLGMRLVLAVSGGSAQPARVVVLRHEPPGVVASPVLALVGKGVTFDTGGISIKPAAGMDRMKDDMSGAAVVAAAVCALARLGAPCRVIGVIPTVENMPGGRAMRPGDVVVGASGTSVEILNTDAEGRLILADALWYARQLGATHMVDVATLTGACVVALGRTVSGLFGGCTAWVETVRDAGRRAGERLWPMPIYEEAREQLRSDIADLTNTGGRPGGAVTAAAFLRQFAELPTWAHVDIAGTAWADTARPYQPKGATGVAVRTLIELGMTSASWARS